VVVAVEGVFLTVVPAVVVVLLIAACEKLPIKGFEVGDTILPYFANVGLLLRVEAGKTRLDDEFNPFAYTNFSNFC
jgi:hypothetical protein